MTWSKNFTNPPGETIQESADKVDVSNLSEQYQQQFAAAVSAAKGLVGNDEHVDGDIVVSMSGYSAAVYGAAGSDNRENRSITVSIGGAPAYVPKTSSDTGDLGSGHSS